MSTEAPRTRILHSKRSFGKYPKAVESPAYDASEEDNDPTTDDGQSPAVPLPISRHSNPSANSRPPHLKPANTRNRHHLAHNLLSDSDGIDSPTYDGDIESSTTAGPDHIHKPLHHQVSQSSLSTLNTSPCPHTGSPIATPSAEVTNPFSSDMVQVTPNASGSAATPPATAPREPAPADISKAAFHPEVLTAQNIQQYVADAIAGHPPRPFKINPPPKGRTVRIYADGIYDLFHFGHALQLRQAKLSFPSVYLLVGVNSDEQTTAFKSMPVMNHAERCESARQCRWVDEVVPEAPWIIDQAFLDKYQIDYVAHDEEAYATADSDDAYGFVKSQGKFLPTRRTPGVSTSELLERIVSAYRDCALDAKLEKMGRGELRAEGSDYDDASRRGSRKGSAAVSRSTSPTFVLTPCKP